MMVSGCGGKTHRVNTTTRLMYVNSMVTHTSMRAKILWGGSNLLKHHRSKHTYDSCASIDSIIFNAVLIA